MKLFSKFFDRSLTVLLSGLLISLIVACKKENKEPSIPVVETTEITSITVLSFTCGGNITASYNATVTASGICWDTAANPIIDKYKTTDGTQVGNFSSTASGLAANTLYYVRAYATNEAGTGYGDQIIVRTFTHAITDYDGNSYYTTTIGSQEWMVSNLKVTHYRNGDPITYVNDGTTWSNSSAGSYCYYNNDTENIGVYGNLYNWYAVDDTRNICPVGFHIPSDNEWVTLENYLGGAAVAGIKLKESGTEHWWSNSGTNGTNESNYTALPGGCRYSTGTFSLINTDGYWWSSDSYNTSDSWMMALSYNVASTYHGYEHKTYGFSVRCIKD